MYFAKKSNNNQLPLYISLFKRLANGKSPQANEINEAIKEAKQIHSGQKEIFTATNDYFFLVSYLSSRSGDFLDKLDESAITKDTYQQIARMLSEQYAALEQ